MSTPANILTLIWGTLSDFLRSRADLQTEIIALRHQLNALRQKGPERPVFGNKYGLFVVPTISFKLLYEFVLMNHDLRKILHLSTTANPSAGLIALQLTEALGWDPAPRYIIRDRDGAYGEVFKRRLRAMGILDRPTAPQSP